jgi:hypothetical protein
MSSSSNELEESTAGNGTQAFAYLQLLLDKNPDAYHSLTLSTGSVVRRKNCVDWINQTIIALEASSDVRDLSVQIFDKFLFSHPFQGTESLSIWGLTAAASLVISSKLLGSQKKIVPISFSPYFKAANVAAFERKVLNSIKFDINPMNTPTEIMKMMMVVWPMGSCHHGLLLTIANEIVTEFLVCEESIRFSSPTLAMSAILLAFRKVGVDSSAWMRQIPETFLKCEFYANVLLCQQSCDQYLEVQQPCPVRTFNSKCISPTTQTELFHSLSPSPSSMVSSLGASSEQQKQQEDVIGCSFVPINERNMY